MDLKNKSSQKSSKLHSHTHTEKFDRKAVKPVFINVYLFWKGTTQTEKEKNRAETRLEPVKLAESEGFGRYAPAPCFRQRLKAR